MSLVSPVILILLLLLHSSTFVSSYNGCMELLPEPCQCMPANNSKEIRCVGAKFGDIDMDYFVAVGSGHFHMLRSVTFHGNSFSHLPPYLFGSYVVNIAGLEALNFSRNSISNISGEAFCGMERLETLDLSYNKLMLNSDNDSDLSIFKPFSGSLKLLNMKSTFDQPLDSKLQMLRLRKVFDLAKFRQLHFLDLSSNSIDYLPKDFLCGLTELRNLNLSDNHFTTLNLIHRCFKNLKTLDLSENKFVKLDSFFLSTINGLKADYAVRLAGNSFECNCNSTDYLTWIQKHAAKFDAADNLTCAKASPIIYAGKSIISHIVFHIDQLDCNEPVGSQLTRSLHVVLFVLSCLTSVLYLSPIANLAS